MSCQLMKVPLSVLLLMARRRTARVPYTTARNIIERN